MYLTGISGRVNWGKQGGKGGGGGERGGEEGRGGEDSTCTCGYDEGCHTVPHEGGEKAVVG